MLNKDKLITKIYVWIDNDSINIWWMFHKQVKNPQGQIIIVCNSLKEKTNTSETTTHTNECRF